MERRRLLQFLAVSGASATLGMGATTLKRALATGNSSSWGYVGEGAPENWGNLSSAYVTCQSGVQQSPVNLQAAVNSTLTPVTLQYSPIPLTILNNGHTIQVNAAGGRTLELNGETFELLQFHFHLPSEHQAEGKEFPMELHFVHANAKGELAVLGVFLAAGDENSALQPVWNAMPRRTAKARTIPGVQVDIAKLLPADQSTFRYFGSLTTPPCSEIVNWVVYKEPVQVSAAQIEQFREIFSLNARPIQPLRRRFLLSS